MKRQKILSFVVVGLVTAAGAGAQSPMPHHFVDDFRAPVFTNVTSMVSLPASLGGDLVVAGIFERIGGIACRNVARWDGTQFLPLGDGLDSVSGTSSAVVFDDGFGPMLYAMGATAAGPGVHRFDGVQWLQVGADLGGSLQRLEIADDGTGAALYCLNVTTVGGTNVPSRVVRLENGAWVPFGAAIPGASASVVQALVAFDHGSGPRIHIAVNLSGIPLFGGVFQWDGSGWSRLGTLGLTTNFSDQFNDLLVADFGSGPELYVAGTLSAPISGYVAKWSGTDWVGVGTMGQTVYTLESIVVGGSNVLVAGCRDFNMPGIAWSSVRQWNGTAWSNLGSLLIGSATDLCVHDDGSGSSLFVSGIAYSGATRVESLAKLDGLQWNPLVPYMRPLGQGLDGEVIAATVFDDGAGPAVYAGGRFTLAGGMPIRRLARWNGSSWDTFLDLATGTSSNAFVATLRSFASGGKSRLIVGGQFPGVSSNISAISQWDGMTWSPLGSGVTTSLPTLTAIVWATCVYDDGSGPSLYAAGQFNRAGGLTCMNIARWDGSQWSTVGGGVGTSFTTEGVYALSVYDDGSGPKLYAGGDFQSVSGLPCGSFARWDGSTWEPVSSGATGDGATIYALHVEKEGPGSALYVGGDFTHLGGVAAKSIARLDGAGVAPLGSGITGGVWTGAVASLASYDDGGGRALYVGGQFSHADGVAAECLARFQNGVWAAIGSGLSSSTYYAVANVLLPFTLADGPGLFVGGRFESADGVDARNFARWAPVAPLAEGLWLIDPAAEGTVGSGAGGPFEVLTVNGVGGLGHAVKLTTGQTATISVNQPPITSYSAGFALFLDLELPSPSDVMNFPDVSFATSFAFQPFDPGNPLLFTLTDGLGLGLPALLGASGTPWSFTTPPTLAPITFALQGVIADPSQKYGLAITNAVVVSLNP